MIAFRSALLGFCQRAVACGSAGLLLALTIFAASPHLHGELHDDHAQHHDSTCAVTLYASGVEPSSGELAVHPRTAIRAEQIHSTASQACFASPRYLLPPERGPPVARH